MQKENYETCKRKNKERIRKIMMALLLMLLLGCTVYIAFYFWELSDEKQEMEDLLNSIEINLAGIDETEINHTQAEKEEPQLTERMLKVRKLKKENSDVIGWIEIKDTNINYPVMQADENNDKFYMDHNYKKEKNKQGSIYLEEQYDWSIPSNNFLLFGHNNSLDGSMFADLLKYEDESFYKKHQSIRFTTTDDDSEYEIISAFRSRIYYKSETDVFRYYYFFNPKSEEEYNKFVKNAKEASLYDTGKNAKYGDQLITLSTCAYHVENGRFAVVGRKSKNIL